MAIYVGINGVPTEINGVYVGINGVPVEVVDIYAGDKSNPTPVYSSVKDGETVFTSSGTFTVPRGIKSIDIFCVGGGNGGYCKYEYTEYVNESTIYDTATCQNKSCSYVYKTTKSNPITLPAGYIINYKYYEYGHGGLYYTATGVPVTPGSSIAITVGAGVAHGASATTSSAGSYCTSASGSIANYDTTGKGGYSYGYEYKWEYYPFGTTSDEKCPYCGSNDLYVVRYSIKNNYITSYGYAKAYPGGYAFGDSTRSLYGCGGGYRSASSGSGDGGVDNAYGYSGSVIIKWAK